jgi:hypothetical protein
VAEDRLRHDERIEGSLGGSDAALGPAEKPLAQSPSQAAGRKPARRGATQLRRHARRRKDFRRHPRAGGPPHHTRRARRHRAGKAISARPPHRRGSRAPLAGYALRPPPAQPQPSLHAHRRHDARPRHRRHHRHLLRCLRFAPSPAAVSGCRSAHVYLHAASVLFPRRRARLPGLRCRPVQREVLRSVRRIQRSDPEPHWAGRSRARPWHWRYRELSSHVRHRPAARPPLHAQ